MEEAAPWKDYENVTLQTEEGEQPHIQNMETDKVMIGSSIEISEMNFDHFKLLDP
jgi:hypothetical protein